MFGHSFSSCWERARDGGIFPYRPRELPERNTGPKNPARMPQGKLNTGKRRKACQVLLFSLKRSHLKKTFLRKSPGLEKTTKKRPTKPQKDKARTHPVPHRYFPLTPVSTSCGTTCVGPFAVRALPKSGEGDPHILGTRNQEQVVRAFPSPRPPLPRASSVG